MKAHILQHVPFEGPGHIGDWLAARGADVGTSRLWESPALPDPAALRAWLAAVVTEGAA